MLNENMIDLSLVQQYLEAIDSALVGQEIEPIHLYEKLQLVHPVTEQMFTPRNVALLFFHPKPHEFFTVLALKLLYSLTTTRQKKRC